MITQQTINKIKDIIGTKEVAIVEVNQGNSSIAYTLPYSSTEMCLFVEADTEDAQIVEICEGINSELESMIDHLDESKLSVPVLGLD